MRIAVRFVHPETGTREVTLGDVPLIVGREHGGADVALADGRISRRHGRLWVADGEVWFEDLGSSNGSWVDGRRIQAPVLVKVDPPVVVGETALSRVAPSAALIEDGMTVQMHVPAAEGNVAEVLSAVPVGRYTAALYDVVQALLGSTSRELISRAMRIIHDVVPAAQRVAVVAWPPDDSGRLAHLVPPRDLESGGPAEVPTVSVSLARHAVQRGEALMLAASDPSDVQLSALRHGIRGAIYVPLITAETGAIGVLCVDTPRPATPYTADDLAFVRGVGGLLATALAAEQARDEVRRIETEARALEARRDAMAAFLQIASHDLRNPLTVILVGAKALRQDPALVERLSESIVNAGNRAMDLIRTYLELAALDAGQGISLSCGDVDVRRLVDDEIAFVTAAATRRRLEGLTFHSDVRCERVWADPHRLRQILGNLLSNAIKYSPDGGEISVEVEDGPAGVTFHVRDQGVGISAENQALLFRQFQRVDNSVAEGIGLGLWLTAALVAAHRGRIWLCSSEDEGSTFSFMLPHASPGATTAPTPAPA